MGALDSLSDFLSASRTGKKRKVMQTADIKVKMDCDGCERKIKNAVSSINGVESVDVNRKMSKVTVSGYMDPVKVLKKVQSTGKKAEMWPYVPYNLVAYPYAAGAYDKKAPSGYVRRVDHGQAVSNAADDEKLMSLFSDENPNACSVM